MNITQSRVDNRIHPACEGCGTPVNDGGEWIILQPGLGLDPSPVHVRCETEVAAKRQAKALQVSLGVTNISVRSVPRHPWKSLVGLLGRPNLRLYADSQDGVLAVLSPWDIDLPEASLLFAETLGLSLTPILRPPWQIDEEFALAFALPNSDLQRGVRAMLQHDVCFACGYTIDDEDALSFSSVMLPRAHRSCLSVARELAWHELSVQWSLTRYEGPSCPHLIGECPQAPAARTHAEGCNLSSTRGHPAMDHRRAWTVDDGSPWLAIVPAGSLILTSEPYDRESMASGGRIVVGDASVRTVVYPEIQIHHPAQAGYPGTTLHVWLPDSEARVA